MVTQCREDCKYYSTYTKTCDYTLINFQSRGCPTDACTRFKEREEKRSWNPYKPVPGKTTEKREEEEMYMPEPPVTPPEKDLYMYADCGHEVYEGESLFEWEDGMTLCPECMEDKLEELTLEEKAKLMGCGCVEVDLRRGTGGFGLCRDESVI